MKIRVNPTPPAWKGTPAQTSPPNILELYKREQRTKSAPSPRPDLFVLLNVRLRIRL